MNTINHLENADKFANDILNSPVSSDWLRWSLRSALHRDPVDAVMEAELLFVTLAHRLDEIMKASLETETGQDVAI